MADPATEAFYDQLDATASRGRAEHVAWCKQRALAETEPTGMLASMLSDMRKHPDTNDPDFLAWAMLAGTNRGHDAASMRHFIEGFN